ncbi:hypothetical protein AURANDRAFT_61474 [Aureococcus anophagefferens]|uniref:Uncharacterized protein n=1 Tax=Aureococcus anophagefferens TaxID=44056 RepID=F0XYK5_AURAN|nr:hypothetical protein AURANDRAFT_61474 [Aureococcus anophagefferens]EGB12133.1 hypothetical protein AURANDRAFT_61474 [Aureococcus anophagefferens]|eukprot:XP_009033217.1 hypothetical protein AURANDRAFT_61474 [Aureococcus anophagefferens]
MPSTSAQAKARGSSLYAAKDYAGAARCFGEAIAAAGPADDAELHVYYGNRCACYQQLRRWREALEDAEAATSIKPGWAKGWARLGACLRQAGRGNEARAALAKAAELEPANASYARAARGDAGPAFAAGDGVLGTLVKAAAHIQVWFAGLDGLNKVGVVVAVVFAFYFGLMMVQSAVMGLKRLGVGGPRSRPRGVPPPSDPYERYAAPAAAGPACCDKYGRRTYGGTYDAYGRPARGHPDYADDAYGDAYDAPPPPPRRPSSYGSYGGSSSYGSGGGMGMMGFAAIMVAAWKLPPYFGHAPFFGMSPMTFMWLVQMLQNQNRRGGRRMPMGGMGGLGGLGGFGRRRGMFF